MEKTLMENTQFLNFLYKVYFRKSRWLIFQSKGTNGLRLNLWLDVMSIWTLVKCKISQI